MLCGETMSKPTEHLPMSTRRKLAVVAVVDPRTVLLALRDLREGRTPPNMARERAVNALIAAGYGQPSTQPAEAA